MFPSFNTSGVPGGMGAEFRVVGLSTTRTKSAGSPPVMGGCLLSEQSSALAQLLRLSNIAVAANQDARVLFIIMNLCLVVIEFDAAVVVAFFVPAPDPLEVS